MSLVAFQDLGMSLVTFIDTKFDGKCFIEESHMARETAYFVESCHHEDLSLILKTHTESKQANKLGMERHTGRW